MAKQQKGQRGGRSRGRKSQGRAARRHERAGERHILEIKSLGAQGDGISDLEGLPVFVPGAVPGDRVGVEIIDLRKNGIEAALKTVETASEHRVEPVCQHFGACGGCQLQMLSPALYRDWVKNRAQMALAHHDFDANLVRDPVITGAGTRRRLALKALKTAAGVVLGFSGLRSHTIIDVGVCPIALPVLNELIAPLRSLLATLMDTRGTVTVHLTATSTGVDCVFEGDLDPGYEGRERLVDFAQKFDLASLMIDRKGFRDPVATRRQPMMEFAGHSVPLPPAAFIQASAEGEAALIDAVVSAAEGATKALDLFAGIGTFTMPLAQTATVHAVEGARPALEALKAGAGHARGLKGVTTEHRDLFRRPLEVSELRGYDFAVFDPPRAGAESQASTLAKSDIPVVAAVSCNPNTFSRDARLLAEGGYILEAVLPVDQFLWSPHLEIVGVFKRQ